MVLEETCGRLRHDRHNRRIRAPAHGKARIHTAVVSTQPCDIVADPSLNVAKTSGHENAVGQRSVDVAKGLQGYGMNIAVDFEQQISPLLVKAAVGIYLGKPIV